MEHRVAQLSKNNINETTLGFAQWRNGRNERRNAWAHGCINFAILSCKDATRVALKFAIGRVHMVNTMFTCGVAVGNLNSHLQILIEHQHY